MINSFSPWKNLKLIPVSVLVNEPAHKVWKLDSWWNQRYIKLIVIRDLKWLFFLWLIYCIFVYETFAESSYEYVDAIQKVRDLLLNINWLDYLSMC